MVASRRRHTRTTDTLSSRRSSLVSAGRHVPTYPLTKPLAHSVTYTHSGRPARCGTAAAPFVHVPIATRTEAIF